MMWSGRGAITRSSPFPLLFDSQQESSMAYDTCVSLVGAAAPVKPFHSRVALKILRDQ